MAEQVSPAPNPGRGGSRSGAACSNCHVRKVKCDLAARRAPPCTRCAQLDVACHRFTRRQRTGRVLNSVLSSQATNSPQPQPQPAEQDNDTEALRTFFSTLGVGDIPRALVVPGLDDISRRTSTLVDFLSQDFSQGSISDYQVTFNDNYSNITRVLANEFGQGFTDDVHHHRDAPFIRRSHGGIPRTLTLPERGVLTLQGAFSLPRREIADAFVSSFFDRVHPAMPVVDRSSFLRHYYAMSSESTELSLLLVQSVLLSGSTTYKHPDLVQPATEVSRRLYVRAKALLENRFEQDRLILVQSHLLVSTFASDSCDDTVQNMWLSIGAAVRTAQGMGMHRNLGKAKASPVMRRRWKRIWWSLFIHDTLCSFEWGRPRAIHLEDCDVELLSREDLSEEELGALPRAEESQFFMVICDLCLIIGEWLDLLRPGKVRYAPKHGPGSQAASSADQDRKVQRTRELVAQMSTWHQQLPAILKSPEDCAGFSLWSATIHIAYCAAMLRFHLLLADETDIVFSMANRITKVCQDLHHQGLLYSLWTFGIHELDLAMGQHARQANSRNRELAAAGLDNLRLGLPLMEHLSERNSVASQGSAFYKLLIERGESGQLLSPRNTEANIGGGTQRHDLDHTGLAEHGYASILDLGAELSYDLDFHGLGFSGLAHFTGQPWDWYLEQ
ncbi:hypothetical protein FOVG_18457 [Fusarium oxysporum f. sp. pisi HDV247]|uniref:Zn(2)-C6 fungal-type domain-containing protein n=2 Tax=Fusarium oxysporum f. sp. pisi HDV247 TaxID=1080344 RepID=W9NBH5_FUSOX|nr:hypothetical protein FOVG_18457 [Fusarium oxysporum f. sp. pisi HDV247]EXA30139.1 hypothetical protein FOVG_18457 [Fusarium oxysporum f. sp. pisi HDV247]